MSHPCSSHKRGLNAVVELVMFAALYAQAGVFTVTSITTDEGMNFDGVNGGTELNPLVPVGYNSVTSYSYTDGVNPGTVVFNGFYSSLPVATINTEQIVQPSQYTAPLFPTAGEYLNAGVNGMSLSTGINKIKKNLPDTFRFTLTSIDISAVGDGIPDFFAADIASGQSDDTIYFLDASSNLLASRVLNSNDWTQALGYQKIDRFDLTTGTHTLNGDDNSKPVNAIALELSEFSLEPGVTWEYLADHAVELQVGIPYETKTDYAFLFAVDSRTINVAPIPEPAAMGLITLGGLFTWAISRFQRRTK